ncbi:MAG: P1 family peptidase [Desulfosarcina sp.]|nr:P1 family peptidase [Desulfosarcina sp.]
MRTAPCHAWPDGPLFGLARIGASFANGSGDYAIAFSVADDVHRTPERRRVLSCLAELPNEGVSPFFQAAIAAVEEAILNSRFNATTIIVHNGFIGEALPLDRVMDLIDGGCGKRLLHGRSQKKGGQAWIQACPRRRVDE